jgi:phosphoenolpyruvate carboxykinase (ATP)
MKLSITRAIIDAIHDGTLAQANFADEPFFGLAIPDAVNGVPNDVLDPKKTWSDPAAYDAKANKLAGLFIGNFRTYESGVSDEVVKAGPTL